MVHTSGLLTVASLFLIGLSAHASSVDDPPPRAGDVQLKLEQISASPYPCQAVRLRLSIVNGTSAPVGPFQFIDLNVQVQIKEPGQQEFKPVRGYLTWESNRPSLPFARERRENRVPLFVEPEKQAFLSFAVAADWTTERRQAEGKEQRSVWVARPLFSVPGKYTLKCQLGRGLQEKPPLEQVIDIEVREPQGDDEAVLRLLKKEESLASTLLHPIDPPDKALIPKLKDLVDRYPNSSYVDYARFALARGYWRGIGVDPPTDRVSRAMAADQLEKIVENRWDPKLEKVVPSRFAYLPNALIQWKSVEPVARESTLRRLDRVFPDSVEWLEEFAASLTRADERRKDAEFILGKEFPREPSDPRFMPFDHKVTQAFIAEEWKSYRKRAPKPEEEPRRIPG